ncbi:protein-serine/threonine kinase, partial [Clonorchis sinensis]
MCLLKHEEAFLQHIQLEDIMNARFIWVSASHHSIKHSSFSPGAVILVPAYHGTEVLLIISAHPWPPQIFNFGRPTTHQMEAGTLNTFGTKSRSPIKNLPEDAEDLLHDMCNLDDFQLVRQGLVERLKQLIRERLDETHVLINTVADAELSCLHQAARRHDLECVKTLIEYGKADVNLKAKDGLTPLHFAAKYEKILPKDQPRKKSVPMTSLVRNAHNINEPSNEIFDEIIQYLYRSGANLEKPDQNGMTALHYAASRNNLSAARQLIMLGAYLECKDNENMTPLLLAVRDNHLDAVQMLLNAGTNGLTVDRYGCNILHHACHNGDVHVLDFLQTYLSKTHGSDCTVGMLNSVNNKGQTPVHLAILSKSPEITEICIQLGRRPSLRSYEKTYRSHATDFHLDRRQQLVYSAALRVYHVTSDADSHLLFSIPDGFELYKRSSGYRFPFFGSITESVLLRKSAPNIVCAVSGLIRNVCGTDLSLGRIECIDNPSIFGRYPPTALAANAHDAEKQWSLDWHLPLNDEKCVHMSFGGDSANSFVMHGEKGPEDITRIDAKKDLGIWLSPNLSFSLHLEKSAQKAFAVLRMIRRTFSRITRTDFQILYGAYVRPLLEYANPVVYSGRTKDVILIERVQRAATKMVAGLKSMDYETRLVVLDLFPLEYRRLRGDLILTYALFEQGLANRFSTVDPANTRRGHVQANATKRFHEFRNRCYFSRDAKRMYEKTYYSHASSVVSTVTLIHGIIQVEMVRVGSHDHEISSAWLITGFCFDSRLPIVVRPSCVWIGEFQKNRYIRLKVNHPMKEKNYWLRNFSGVVTRKRSLDTFQDPPANIRCTTRKRVKRSDSVSSQKENNVPHVSSRPTLAVTFRNGPLRNISPLNSIDEHVTSSSTPNQRPAQLWSLDPPKVDHQAAKLKRLNTRRIEFDIQELSHSINKDASQLSAESLMNQSIVGDPLEKLLGLCNQTEVKPFEECFDTETLDGLAKIGEGVYGEVFQSPKGHVIKVFPVDGKEFVNGEKQMTFADVYPEVFVSKKLSELAYKYRRNRAVNFSQLKKATVVQGSLPEAFSSSWRKFKAQRGSDNECPDFLPPSQQWMVLEFEFAGEPLANVR